MDDEGGFFDYVEDDNGAFHIDLPEGMTEEQFQDWADDLADLLEREMDDYYIDWIETGYGIDSPSG